MCLFPWKSYRCGFLDVRSCSCISSTTSTTEQGEKKVRTQSFLKCHSIPAARASWLHCQKEKEKMDHKPLGRAHSTACSPPDPFMQSLTLLKYTHKTYTLNWLKWKQCCHVYLYKQNKNISLKKKKRIPKKNIRKKQVKNPLPPNSPF